MFGSKLTAYLAGSFQFSTPDMIFQIPHQVNKHSVISATSSQIFGRVGLMFMSEESAQPPLCGLGQKVPD